MAKKTAKKSAKKTVKKTVGKAAKKTAKKSVKKAAPKNAKKAVKKTAKARKKPVKKISKKTAAKAVVKKNAKTLAAKASAKPAKALVRKNPPSGASPETPVDYSKAVTPLGDRLVVRLVNTERVTAGGLIIPDTASLATGYLKAQVLAVGAGGKNKKGHVRPLDVQIGDTVLFAEHAGAKIRFKTEDLQIIHESDVMGIIQK